MNFEVYYPTVDEVLALHASIVDLPLPQAQMNVRDHNLLGSALARPQNAAAYEGADLSRQAATLLWGLIKNHPLHDGNKRTAYVAMQTFLRANGVSVSADPNNTYEIVMAVARGELDVETVDAWIARNLSEWSAG